MLLQLMLNSYAQTKIIDIANASIVYHEGARRFTINGIKCLTSTDTPSMPDPYVIIFIETGDGNYINTIATYQNLLSNEFSIPYTYKRLARYRFSVAARIVKTYDKGGPRTKSMQSYARGLYYQANAVHNKSIPDSVALLLFPHDIVPGDTISGVITINKRYAINNMDNVRLYLHDSIKISNVRMYGESVEVRNANLFFGKGLDYNIYKFLVSPVEEQDEQVVNIFFEAVPAMGLTLFPAGDSLTFGLHSANNTLPLVDSHDPNRLRLLINCTGLQPAKRTIFFALDIENKGFAPETNIRMGLKFDEKQIDAHSIKFTLIRFQDKDALQSRRALEHRYNCNLAYKFKNVILSGTNHLGPGHPETIGLVCFSLDLKPGVRNEDLVEIGALIRFGDVETPTNIAFKVNSLKQSCEFKELILRLKERGFSPN
jgi:hypothetical protein